MTYAEKLKDPRWQKKRLEIFNRDNWKCTKCGNDKITLAVHHESYSGNPWEVSNDKLTTICEPCHKKEHNIQTKDFRLNQPLIVKEIYDISKKFIYFSKVSDSARMNKIIEDYSLREEKEIYLEILKKDLQDERLIEILTEIKNIDKKRQELRKGFYE